MSSEKIKSKIFPYKNRPWVTSDLKGDLRMLHNQLGRTYALIANAHARFPDYNKQSKDILAEMTELLFHDAVINVNLCKVF